MRTICIRCGLEKEMSSQNFYYDTGHSKAFLCNDCRIVEASRKVLDALKGCSHLIDLEKIEKILLLVTEIEQSKETADGN